MDLANWIYLTTGLGVGFGSRWLFSPKFLTAKVVQSTPPVDVVLSQTQLACLMAQQMSQFKGGFLARTSHELRSPLSNIIGLHQLILSDLCDNPAEERQFIAQAHDAALQLVKLIDEVLNVARLEYGTNKLEVQPLQLSAVLEEVCNILRMIAANRRHNLQLTAIAPDIYVLADPRWLRQVILSLIDTAMLDVEDGAVFYLSVPLATDSNFINICLDLPLAPSKWNDPVDLLESKRVSGERLGCKENLATETTSKKNSPGFVLLLTQTLLEVMQGKLEMFPTPISSQKEPTTRLQISIPRLTPDTGLLELEP